MSYSQRNRKIALALAEGLLIATIYLVVTRSLYSYFEPTLFQRIVIAGAIAGTTAFAVQTMATYVRKAAFASRTVNNLNHQNVR